MCGIAGFLNLSNSQFKCDEYLLEKMQKSIAHRGPDGHRVWVSHAHQLGLAHRRLSIVDLSKSAFQPLFDKEKSIAVCCNGEIYNHKTLRKELESFGYKFKSQSDTEVIVYAYKKWGISCLNKLEGMFAIVIADLKKDELYLVRDRMGVKPLYFSTQSGVLSFASEIKALWQLPWIEKAINPQGLYHYLTFLVTPSPMTLYKGIYKLPPAYYLKVNKNKSVSFQEWYTPLKRKIEVDDSVYKSEAICVRSIRSLLSDSVKKRLMADVPIGAFLSGGIDSSLIVALMASFTDQVKTFNVSFADGPEFSETNWARKIARKFNTDHHEIIISEKEAFDFFENMVHYQDEPLADCVCIPLYYVSKLLKDAGVTVVLVGEGADELFCGYNSYAQYINWYNRYWRYSQKYIPAFARKGIYQLASPVLSQRPNRLELLKNWAENKSLFWSGAMAFSEQWKQELFSAKADFAHDPIIEAIYNGINQDPDSYTIVDYHLKKLKKIMPESDFLTSITYLELKQRLPELLLMRVDKMTMATSVEGRVPFLDHALVEYALHMPNEFKYKNGINKYILKKAAEGVLPHDVIYRKKVGFAAPTSRWFKEGRYFRSYFLDMLKSKKHEWNEFIDVNQVRQLFEKNQQPNQEYSLQLWALQNLMASNISDAL
ncbi:MAG: asparagine synthase (glutamine-hydrolyzing) [Candidatus Babeliales bacterium]